MCRAALRAIQGKRSSSARRTMEEEIMRSSKRIRMITALWLSLAACATERQPHELGEDV